jgi:hypothetical protein
MLYGYTKFWCLIIVIPNKITPHCHTTGLCKGPFQSPAVARWHPNQLRSSSFRFGGCMGGMRLVHWFLLCQNSWVPSWGYSNVATKGNVLLQKWFERTICSILNTTAFWNNIRGSDSLNRQTNGNVGIFRGNSKSLWCLQKWLQSDMGSSKTNGELQP